MSLKPSANSPLLDPEQLAYEAYSVAPWRKKLSELIVNGLLSLRHLFVYRWLWLTNLLNLLFLVGTFVAPLLVATGWSQLAQPLYRLYGLVCLQRPGHSLFLVGYQMGMEVRMVAIYAGFFAAGLLFSQTNEWLPKRLTSLLVYGLLTLPMLFDVFSQTFGLRDSDSWWRGSTGFLFGVATVWFFYPRFSRVANRSKLFYSR